MRVERILGTFGRGSELADLRPVSRAFQRRFGWEVACWPASRQPVCLQIVLLPNGGSIQTIWYYMVSVSVLLVFSLELQSFNFQRAQVKPSVLNNEVSTVATSCDFPAAFFDLLIFFHGSILLSLIFLFWPTGQPISVICLFSLCIKRTQLQWLKKKISLVDNSCVKCLGHVVPEENPGAHTGYAVENASVGCLRNSLVNFGISP